MPTYLFECPKHGEFEDMHKIEDTMDEWPCPKCNAWSKKLINFGGAAWGDEAPRWLVGSVEKGREGSSAETLLHPSDRAWETRSEFDRWRKERGIEHAG